MEEILDSNLNDAIEKLSNFQLVGLLEGRTEYARKINDSIKTEIKRRKLSDDEVSLLVQKYQNVEIEEKIKLEYDTSIKLILGLMICSLLLFKPILMALVGSLVILVSVYRIKQKFERRQTKVIGNG